MGFINSFLSYLLLVVIFAIAAGAAVALGIFWRKRKDTQTASGAASGDEKTQ